jgi:hypothetical protein
MTSTARHTASEPPSVLEDVSPLVGFIAQAGPPPFVAIALLVFGSLMLAGPFALAVTLVVAMVLAAVSVVGIIAAAVAIAVAPYVLVQRARRYWAGHSFRLVGHRARAAGPVIVHREPIA